MKVGSGVRVGYNYWVCNGEPTREGVHYEFHPPGSCTMMRMEVTSTSKLPPLPPGKRSKR